jgi:hypothetical protein
LVPGFRVDLAIGNVQFLHVSPQKTPGSPALLFLLQLLRIYVDAPLGSR